MKRLYLSVFVVSLLVSGICLRAQQSEVCGQCYLALQQDLFATHLSEDEALALLDVTSGESWSKSGGNLETGAEFPIEGLPFKGHGNASNFEEEKKKAFAMRQFSSDFHRSLSTITKVGRDRGFGSFDNCVELCTGYPNVYAYVVNNTAKVVQLKLYWLNPPSDRPLAPIQLETTILGGKASGAPNGRLVPIGTTLGPRATRFVDIQRDEHESVSGTVTGGGYSANFWAPVPPAPIPPHECNRRAGAWFVNPPQASDGAVRSDATVQVAVFNACPVKEIKLDWACKSTSAPESWDPSAQPSGGPVWELLPGMAIPQASGYDVYVTMRWPAPANRSGALCQLRSRVWYPDGLDPVDNYVGVRLQ